MVCGFDDVSKNLDFSEDGSLSSPSSVEVLPSETLDLGRRLIWKKGILGWIGAGPLLHCSTGGPGIWLV